MLRKSSFLLIRELTSLLLVNINPKKFLFPQDFLRYKKAKWWANLDKMPKSKIKLRRLLSLINNISTVWTNRERENSSPIKFLIIPLKNLWVYKTVFFTKERAFMSKIRYKRKTKMSFCKLSPILGARKKKFSWMAKLFEKGQPKFVSKIGCSAILSRIRSGNLWTKTITTWNTTPRTNNDIYYINYC